MRELYVIGGIVALGVFSAIALVIYAITLDEGSPDPAAATTPTSPEATVEATPVATATAVGSVEPTTPADEPVASLYQPVAWDHPTQVNRTPPSSLDEAIKERAVHANGWTFEGTPPPVFDPGALDAEVCPLVPSVGRAQSSDWVLHAGSPAVAGQPDTPGQRYFVLFPIDPDVIRAAEFAQGMLRIRAIDTANWTATHTTELTWGLEEDGEGNVAYRFIYESPRDTRWMAIVTAGPLWGCFTLEVGRDAVHWPAPGGQSFHWFPDPPADDPGDDDALRDYTTFGGELAGSADRVCVNITASPSRVRSGQFGVARAEGFGNTPDGFDPFQPASKVIWLPQYQDRLGTFAMRTTLATDVETRTELGSPDEPVHTYEVIADGPSVPGAPRFTFVTGPVLPRPGTWTMVATAEPYNWGCFMLTVGTDEVVAASGR